MKLLFSSFFLIYFSPSLFSQTEVPVKEITVSTTPADTNEVNTFLKVEVEAGYPGGDEGWKKFLIRGLIKVSNEAAKNKEPAGKYNLIVAFIVEKDGTISINSVTSNPVNKYLETKCAYFILQCKTWKPATLNDKPVKAYRKQPITIVIE